jgi:hypothetical protein
VITLRAALIATMLFCAASAEAGVDLWGTIVWGSGTPAAGIELRLVQRGNVLPARIYTNSAGRYGLSHLTPPTTEYTLQVLRGGTTVKVVRLPQLKDGERIPNIVMP